VLRRANLGDTDHQEQGEVSGTKVFCRHEDDETTYCDRDRVPGFMLSSFRHHSKGTTLAYMKNQNRLPSLSEKCEWARA